MNRRQHLLMRIDFMRPYIYSAQMKRFMDDVARCITADEDDICDLESRVQFLEEQLSALNPPPPEKDE